MTSLKGSVGLCLTLLPLLAGFGCSDKEGEDAGSPGQTTAALPEETAALLELDATYPEGFSFLNGVRELPGGTILVADPLVQILLRIDMDASTADTLGRVGPGPQEYQQPDQVFPLPGDSSLLVDLGKTQLTVIHPDGTFGEGMSMMLPREDGFPDILHPRFVDEAGNIYHQAGRSRAGGFSVEWTFPDGRRVVGPPHHFETQAVAREDKEALLTGMRSSGISMITAASRTGGVQNMSMSRGLPSSGDGPGVDDFEWAETFPAFRNDRTLISPRGEAWVERWVPVGADTRLEVFNQDGIWRGSVVLPPRRRLLGFGRGPGGGEVAYLTRTDEYDLKWLERYRVVR